MSDINEKNLVGMLREKTEEADLEQYLKRTIGGFTKKSVQEYLSAFRKKQMAMEETFNQNLQTLYEEKRSLQGTNELLRSKCIKAETELKNLSDAVATYKLDDNEYSAQDIIALKSKLAAYEGGIKKANSVNLCLKRQIEQLNDLVTEKEKGLEKSRQETQIQRELLLTEKEETKKQRDLVLELSDSVEEFREQARYLKGVVTEGKTAELNARIDELIASNSKLEEIIAQRNVELAEKDKAIESLRDENKALKESTNHLSKSIDQMMVQNEKLTLSNKEIAFKLSEAHQNLIQLITEKSEVTVEKLIFSRKLEEAQLRISSLEMEMRKLSKAESIAKVSIDNNLEN